MATGTVKWFNESKGFGFITPDEGSKDCFVHVNEISSGPINDGDKVEFEIGGLQFWKGNWKTWDCRKVRWMLR